MIGHDFIHTYPTKSENRLLFNDPSVGKSTCAGFRKLVSLLRMASGGQGMIKPRSSVPLFLPAYLAALKSGEVSAARKRVVSITITAVEVVELVEIFLVRAASPWGITLRIPLGYYASYPLGGQNCGVGQACQSKFA